MALVPRKAKGADAASPPITTLGYLIRNHVVSIPVCGDGYQSVGIYAQCSQPPQIPVELKQLTRNETRKRRKRKEEKKAKKEWGLVYLHRSHQMR